MSKYEVIFFNKDGDDECFRLDIEGGSRTKLLYNIITEEWDQGGTFTVDSDDWTNIIWNFFQFFCDDPPYPYEDPEGYVEFLYNLEMLCEYDLNIRSVISKYSSEIKELEILDTLCSSIIENFDHEAAGTAEFYYEIKKL
jgi:hypothetical protein